MTDKRPWPVIDAYRVTITEAYRRDEIGTGYSFGPWGGDSRYYRGYDEAVKVRLHPDARLGTSNTGEPMLYMPGTPSGYTLNEAVQAHLVFPVRTTQGACM